MPPTRVDWTELPSATRPEPSQSVSVRGKRPRDSIGSSLPVEKRISTSNAQQPTSIKIPRIRCDEKYHEHKRQVMKNGGGVIIPACCRKCPFCKVTRSNASDLRKHVHEKHVSNVLSGFAWLGGVVNAKEAGTENDLLRQEQPKFYFGDESPSSSEDELAI